MTTRKTGRHVEIEPDWEAAFNLQMRMMPVYSLVYDWCFSDVSCQFSLWLDKSWKLEASYFRNLSWL